MRLIDRLATPLPAKKSRPAGLFSLLSQWCRSPWERPSHAKRRLNQERLQQLAQIDTEPATQQSGRVITLVAALPGRTLDLASFLKPWLRSVHMVGLRGTVLYAGDCQLESARQLYPGIEFSPCQIGKRHLFLERHFPILAYLQSIPDDRVMITDGGDVAFRRDPFALWTHDDQRLYLGREDDLIGESRHTLKKMLDAYHTTFSRDLPVFNPGILGGSRLKVIELLSKLTQEIDRLDCQNVDCDMGIYNKVIHEHYALQDIVTGHPLHSRFSHWEFGTSAAVIHK